MLSITLLHHFVCLILQNLAKILTDDGKRRPSTADEAELHRYYKWSLPEKPLWDGTPIEHRTTANPDAVNTGDTAPASWEGPHLQADSARQSQYHALQAQQLSSSPQGAASTKPVIAQQDARSNTAAASKTTSADQQAALRGKIEELKRKRAAITAEKAARVKAAAEAAAAEAAAAEAAATAAAATAQQQSAPHVSFHDVEPIQSAKTTLPEADGSQHNNLPASLTPNLSNNSSNLDVGTQTPPGTAEFCQRQDSLAFDTTNSCSWQSKSADTAYTPQTNHHSSKHTSAIKQTAQSPANNQHVDQSMVDRAISRASCAGLAPSPKQSAYQAIFSNPPQILKDPLPEAGHYSSHALHSHSTYPSSKRQDPYWQPPHPMQQEDMTRTMTAGALYGSPAPRLYQAYEHSGAPMDIDSGCENTP